MKIKVVVHIDSQAEGDCHGFPYKTVLMSDGGVVIYFWTGDKSPASVLPLLHNEVLPRARQVRDIVYAFACDGDPTGYITPRQDIP